MESCKFAGMGPGVGVRRALEKRITPATQANRPAKDCGDPGRVASILGKEKDFSVPEGSGEGEPRRRLRRSAGEFAAPGRRTPRRVAAVHIGEGEDAVPDVGIGAHGTRTVTSGPLRVKRRGRTAARVPGGRPTPIRSLLQEIGSGDTTGAGRRCCLRFRLPPTPA